MRQTQTRFPYGRRFHHSGQLLRQCQCIQATGYDRPRRCLSRFIAGSKIVPSLIAAKTGFCTPCFHKKFKHFFSCRSYGLPNRISICAFFFRNKADWFAFDTILSQPPALSLCKMAAETLSEKSHQYSGFVSRNLLHILIFNRYYGGSFFRKDFQRD